MNDEFPWHHPPLFVLLVRVEKVKCQPLSHPVLLLTQLWRVVDRCRRRGEEERHGHAVDVAAAVAHRSALDGASSRETRDHALSAAGNNTKKLAVLLNEGLGGTIRLLTARWVPGSDCDGWHWRRPVDGRDRSSADHAVGRGIHDAIGRRSREGAVRLPVLDQMSLPLLLTTSTSTIMLLGEMLENLKALP